MNKISLVFGIVMLLSITIAQAQTFTFSPADSIEGSYDMNNFVSDYIYIENNSGSSLNLSYQMVTNTISSIGWSAALCTNLGCYPSIPPAGNFGAIPNGGQAFLNLHVIFNGITGTAEAKFTIFETGNPSNTGTITFRYHSTTTTSIAQNDGKPEIILFPNPASHFIKISGIEDINNDHLIQIYSLDGKVQNDYKPLIKSGGGYDISYLPNGNYILQMTQKGTPIYTKKFTKY